MTLSSSLPLKSIVFLVVLAVAIAACDGFPPVPSPEAGFHGLGPETLSSAAYDVSADGSVVIGTLREPDGSRQEAFLWVADPDDRGGTMVPLGELPGADRSDAGAVSADGSVVVGSSGFDVFRWEGGTMTGLGGGIGRDASADGSVVVGETGPVAHEAFRWESGVMQPLGTLPGDTWSDASGVSFDGTVIVGESQNSSGDRTEAFRWESGTMTGLGDLAGGAFFSRASSVTPDGSVVVGFSSSDSGTEAFRWTAAEGMVGLGELPGGPFSSVAWDVSADGSVIVGDGETTPTGPDVATIWTEDEGMRELKIVLEGDYGLDLTGWSLHEARGVSDDGTVIVGHGENPDGEIEAWRAVLGEPVGA